MSLVRTDPAAAETRPGVTADTVLDAALTLFAERGYHGTAVSQIAASLGIRTASLYNHMRSKQDLLEAIVGRTLDGVLDDFWTAVGDLSDPVERLRRAIRVYALRHATHRREALVVNRDTTSLPEPARTRMRERRRDHERAVRAIISDGVGTGDFHVDSPALASFAILEMCVSIARWFRDDGPRTAEQVAEEYTDFALRIAGFPPIRGGAGRAENSRGLIARTGERTTVKSEAVLDAALTLFAERGYHGTSLSQIAGALELRVPSLYNHMRSKHDLLLTIVDRTVTGVLDDFRLATAGRTDPLDRLRQATLVYALRHATRRREAIVVNRDTTSLDEPHRAAMQALRREHEHALRGIIEDGVAAGEFTIESPALGSFAIREMCVSIARWFRDDGPISAGQVAEEYSEFAIRIVGAV
jgi:AcrR family transcriptional regulator